MTMRSNLSWRLWVFTVALSCVPVVGIAQACAQWNVSGEWQMIQSNDIAVNVKLEQRGNVITGSAWWVQARSPKSVLGVQQGQSSVVHNGSIDGTIEGNRFNVQAFWTTDGAIGVYSGEVGPQGRIEGRTYHRQHPNNRATWFSSIPLTCASTTQAKKDAPVRGLGKRTPVDKNAAVAKQTAPVSEIGQPARQPATVDTAGNVRFGDGVQGQRLPPPASREPDTKCAQGFVWRVARADDLVCVTPNSRSRVAEENRSAPERWNPSGAYGASTCVTGYVWREAFEGDHVCVTPQRRTEVREENRLSSSRRAR